MSTSTGWDFIENVQKKRKPWFNIGIIQFLFCAFPTKPLNFFYLEREDNYFHVEHE